MNLKTECLILETLDVLVNAGPGRLGLDNYREMLSRLRQVQEEVETALAGARERLVVQEGRRTVAMVEGLEGEEPDADVPEEMLHNVCERCGHADDFWFDRTVEDLGDGRGECMHYRCGECGAAQGPSEGVG